MHKEFGGVVESLLIGHQYWDLFANHSTFRMVTCFETKAQMSSFWIHLCQRLWLLFKNPFSTSWASCQLCHVLFLKNLCSPSMKTKVYAHCLHVIVTFCNGPSAKAKGIARIRHVGCAHSGDTRSLVRIRQRTVACICQKMSNPFAHPSFKRPCAHPS